jgi:hypothetical protein
MLRDVNRNPRQWLDASGRVRVIEGWHPSAPDQIGYNLLVDGDWRGTFGTLDDAAAAAAAGTGVERGKIELTQYPERSGPGGLRLVHPPRDADSSTDGE